ncbi:MAG: MarR family winged helix-turn-helix transcriptional regulator, partial [Pseudomonadota bacterium]|nr:MarR family winged helix-turn-helix transcriptional regulator [Pseudomonadota bacterium]
DRTTLTRNLRVLAEEGLVTISAGKDRRERVVQLTEAGQTAIDSATPLWHKAQSKLIENLGEQRWRRMIEDFADLSDLLEENSD